MHPASKDALLAQLDTFADQGLLRRLGAAFARFMASLGMQEPAQLLACVMLCELEGRGHSCLMLDMLAADPAALLGWDQDDWQTLLAITGAMPASLTGWRKMLSASAQVWRDGEFDFQQPLVLDADRLYLRRYWRDETTVAALVRQRAASMREVALPEARLWLDRLFGQSAREGAAPDWQKLACAIAVRSGLAIITGGPGTGKTYTVARLLALLFALSAAPGQQRIALAAPTGKAAARLKQAIDEALAELAGLVGAALPLAQLTARLGAARTLHSLLGARPDTRKLAYHAGNQLEVDVLILDEASMVHLEMMAALLSALPPAATLILLGDKDQLASVEAGAVLGDLCRDADSGGYVPATASYALAAAGVAIPAQYLGQAGALAQQTVMLRESRRFSGPIGTLALAVNAGAVEQATDCLQAAQDQVLAWLEPSSPTALLKLALDGRSNGASGYRSYLALLKQGPGADGQTAHEQWVHLVLRAFESFRILCAVREGEWGVAGLNQAIEQALDHGGLIRRRGEWYPGRPVMVTRNDYSAGVFNGDIGITLPDPQTLPGAAPSMRVYFLEGDAVRSVLATRLRHVDTAYAMTVHKSQGSEFRHTVLVLPAQTSAVVTRELVYTGITRARDFFTLVTPVPEVFGLAIERRTRRASGLASRLG
ncbi:MAG: exodeoxyribonuclease V subunit alpha [Janthinobacterium lividum]